MDYRKIGTLDEAKVYFKTLCQPMEPECVLKNLQNILNFLQSPADEICFVNMQEKYLPFYYMIILDEELVQTTFLTDECKVIANEILKTLEANKNSFTWEVFFSTQIAGIPVIFRKVYTQTPQPYPREFTEPIRSEFKETWIKTTLNFIKSSRRILKYPEMPRQEARYLYKGILKLKEDEIGPDTLWAPVWEALKLFKLRYEYIVSIHSTCFDYLKFVHFEKVVIRRRSCAVEIANSVASLEINSKESKLLTDGKTGDGIHRKGNDLLISVIDHNELVKTLLEMNITKSGTTVYTLKIDGSNTATEPNNEIHEKVNQSSENNNVPDMLSFSENQVVQYETTHEDTTNIASANDEVANVNLTLIVQGEVNTVDVQHADVIITTANENNLGVSQETITPTDNTNYQNETACNDKVSKPNLECNNNKESDGIVAKEKTTEPEIKPSNIENVSAIEQVKETETSLSEPNVIELNSDEKVASNDIIIIDDDPDVTDVSDSVLPENTAKCDNIQTEVIELDNDGNIVSNDKMPIEVDNCSSDKNLDTEIIVIDEELSKTDETNSLNSNPFLQQISKVQKSCPLFLQEKDFIPSEDTNELNCNIDDLVLKKKMKSIISNETSEIIRYLNEKENLKKTTKPQPSLKSQIKREEKLQRRYQNKIRRKRRLIDTVPTKFILASFKAILDFVNDDSRASMEMVGLNIHEFNVLKKLHGFSPNELPVEQIFNYSCIGLVLQLFNRLNEIDVSVEITWVKPSEYDKKTKTDDNTRGRTLLFTKRPFKRPQNIKNQKSILEKMRLMPPPGRTKVSPGRRKVSRSPSVSPARALKSPARPLMSPAIPSMSCASVRSKSSKNNEVVDLEEDSNKTVSSRPPNAPTGNVAVAMKAKMLEGLSVPLASDKAMRMMRLMGWNGGALGVRGVGLIEPIQPQLDVPKGVGLGHKMFKTTQLNINKLQRKVMYEKYMLEKSTAPAEVNNSGDISNINKEDKHNNINIDTNDKDTHLESVELTVNNNVVENPKGSGWLTNESLLQKIKDKTSNNEAEQKIDTSAKENTIDNSWAKEDILETSGDEDTNTEYEETMIRLRNMNEEGHEKWRVVDDEKLHPYTRERKTKHLSNRIQFLVHLLDLLQTEKSSTVVSFLKKPTGACVGFIDSIIWALNHREERTPAPVLREGRIVDACAKEMEAHGTLMLSYGYKNKYLTLHKSDASSNFNPFVAEAFSECELEITHYVHDSRLYKHMPQGTKGVMRSKIFTNRIILDFLKSGDEERVYFFGKSSVEVRMYIISLISLLNRQMVMYQLGLGNSEHPVFREMLHRMQNFCLLYRFDTQDSYYKILQLVKVDLERRCRVCRLAKESINVINQADNPLANDDKNGEDSDDVDIYPNRFNNSIDDVTESDSDLVTEKNTKCLKANFKPCDTDEIRQTDDCEEYLIGEDWLNSDEQGETITKEVAGSRTDLNDEYISNNLKRYSQIEAFNIEDTEENDIKRNVSHEELSSDFHNWPKRIKRNETNHNVLDHNVKWNTPEKYYKTNVEDPKRKINKQKADENVIESNTSDNLIKSLDDSQNTLVGTDNNKENEDLNIEKIHTNTIDDIDKEAAQTNTLISDVITADEKVAEDKLEVIDQAIKTITDTNSETLPDDNNWPKNLLIVHCDYPKIEICKYGAIGLQSILYEAIKKYRYLPRLKCCGLKNRGIVYTCYDFDSYIWLYDHLPLYKILVYENELHSKHVIRMKVNTFIRFDVEGIFKNIEKFYENIKTDTWKVVSTRDFADYCEIDIEVDNSSLQSIRKEEFSLFIGIDKADVSVLYHN